MVDVFNVDLVDLLPPNLKADKNVYNVVKSLNDELKLYAESIKNTLILSRIDELESEVLDLLAWQYDVFFYNQSYEDEVKRKMIKNSINWHRKLGTVGVMQEIVASVFNDANIVEWFNYGGKPYHFKIEITDTIKDGKTYNKALNLINSVKNVRSKLESLNLVEGEQQSVYVGVVQLRQEHMVIEMGGA